MHIETLKTFCDLVETGSFSKAASMNFVSQSAVSQQVRALEERYDRRLVERGRRGAVPTDAGRLLYLEAKELLERFGQMETRLRDRPAVLSGTVRVATVYSVGLHDLPPHVKTFLETHPQVNVRMEYSRTDRVYEACLDGTIDFGIVALPSRRPQLELVRLRDDELVFVCSPDHALAKLARVPLARLGGQAFVAFDRDIPTRKGIDKILRTHGVAVQIAMEFDNIETIKRSVEAGIGVTILPETALRNEVRAGTLCARPFADGRFTRPVGIIRRRGRELSPAARAFVDLLTREMAWSPD